MENTKKIKDTLANTHETTLNSLLTSLKRSSLNLTNRLLSIDADALFISRVARAYGFHDTGVVANERCGSWYVDPARKRGCAYFKSTDGHNGSWAFSSRRLNLQVLSWVGEDGG